MKTKMPMNTREGKWCYIHTMEHYLAIKKKKILLHVTWMNLTKILMNKKGQTHIVLTVWLHLNEIQEQQKWSMVIEVRRVVIRMEGCSTNWEGAPWEGCWKCSISGFGGWWQVYTYAKTVLLLYVLHFINRKDLQIKLFNRKKSYPCHFLHQVLPAEIYLSMGASVAF